MPTSTTIDIASDRGRSSKGETPRHGRGHTPSPRDSDGIAGFGGVLSSLEKAYRSKDEVPCKYGGGRREGRMYGIHAKSTFVEIQPPPAEERPTARFRVCVATLIFGGYWDSIKICRRLGAFLPVPCEVPQNLVWRLHYCQDVGLKFRVRALQKSELAGREILSEKPRRDEAVSEISILLYYRLLPVMLLRGVYVVDAQSRPRPDSAVFCNLLFGWLHFGMVPNNYLESSPTSLNQGKILFRDSGCNEPEETASEESPAAASDPRLGIH
ncbi:hypothetical protein R3P38DRAFT_2807860 [Favolaschia claudopus]|uniref:Uncharacterized protein n=1 Tax=Favolaschia claudopus TaxID=2862362 RepID=A0AAV9ZJ77_9AGAR